ncbi:MAG: P1 family peptidase [Flavobacteriaceae bacterium]|nr:P1 family peptidase [Flavobacteriaceae bacterium]
MNNSKHQCLIIFLAIMTTYQNFSQNKRIRDYGIEIGVLNPGPLNAITDVEGVKVGHTTLIKDDNIRTGVTAILPNSDNIFKNKLAAAIHIGNGFGKLMGYSQVKELGTLETPIVLTNTLSVPTAANALISYTLDKAGNEDVRSVNAVVGETNDGYLNDIRGRHITEKHVLDAISSAESGQVEEGNVGAGTGTRCFGYKGGIGTASRVVPEKFGGYTVGVLVQSNFGGVFQFNGIPVAKILNNYPNSFKYDVDGSCMMVVITDAPLDARNLERLAKRAMLGLARTGGIASNGSGDYVIAVSVAKQNVGNSASDELVQKKSLLKNEAMSPLFLACIEATEEAIYNSLFTAESMSGRDGNNLEKIPIKKIIELVKNSKNNKSIKD